MEDGYVVEYVKMGQSAYQPCDHGCEWVIQFRSTATGEVKYEACLVEAEQIAKTLLMAVEEGSRRLPV